MKYSLLLGAGLLASETKAQQYSELWGQAGEKWSAGSRLPDFSYAGYHFGEDPLPDVEVACSVKDFGAVGDGVHDDTQAFKDAIAQTERGAIFVPPGRYLITDILWIEKPHLVLRGAGPDRSVLYCPKPLEKIKPHPSATTEGRPTSNYSWSGGIVWIKGKYERAWLTKISGSAQRGERWLDVESTHRLAVGDTVLVWANDDEANTLIDYLYSGDPGETENLSKVKAHMRSRITAIEGQRVQLERPLSFDVRPEWTPLLRGGGATVYESGVEDLGFEFPNTPYEGHFTEWGYNAIAISDAVDCWVRDVRIENADSGIFLRGYNCTINGVLIESEREPDKHGKTGHHGLDMGVDCLLENFDIQTEFIHDITVDAYAARNVVKNGRGRNLTLDHHKRAPYQNLFCNLDVGEGTDIWHCGGGSALGKHSAARGVFWRFQSQQNLTLPPDKFGPPSLMFVGLKTETPSTTDIDGVWWEAIPPEELQPVDLHAAQLKRRLGVE
ncbi:glycosyl hydrolase family 28-related protein [Cerasicoccus maritimus]|uniref:glycosyl hydrolase family 28-related protein n=1 Tax=Cerasicoccus maritimus TaxID=490089 RepID=UPI002852D748|nr:glycosyl hydrolase family 28-related protein [Cerasicoccus maritimus]